MPISSGSYKRQDHQAQYTSSTGEGGFCLRPSTRHFDTSGALSSASDREIGAIPMPVDAYSPRGAQGRSQSMLRYAARLNKA